MHLLTAILALVGLSFVSLSCQQDSEQKARKNGDRYVVVLSADGFRADYIGRTETPAFDAIAAEGLTASFRPCFPSLTFPNHYSMATGLYPDHHGIVSNTFYDRDLGRYSIGNRDAVETPEFYKGDPIWNTAERQGVKTASYFWVGTETLINGGQPTYWHKYNGKVPYNDRADAVIEWLSKPENERPRLVMWYLDEPDHTGHGFGPNSEEVLEQVRRVDATIGYFRERLKELPIADQVDFIVVSDHGMAEYQPENYVNLIDYLDRSDFDQVYDGVPTHIYTKDEEKIEKALKVLSRVPNVDAYRRSEIPSKYAYGENPRIGDIVVIPRIGTYLHFREGGKARLGGAHGYDNFSPEMEALFMAVGPSFKKGSKHEVVPNITLYPLICRLLGITPSENDASESLVDELLAN